jgi:hypothetical protein
MTDISRGDIKRENDGRERRRSRSVIKREGDKQAGKGRERAWGRSRKRTNEQAEDQ